MDLVLDQSVDLKAIWGRTTWGTSTSDDDARHAWSMLDDGVGEWDEDVRVRTRAFYTWWPSKYKRSFILGEVSPQ